ncbi:hypothetical protein AVEN_131709-1 [Araneus ventricosus]|uniref:RNase H type-1 domain-containing protein n=1 Tax=Araneus ventricosus TaxID=182803 RepID=A0A4Y2HT96_ARAVE|nr:hypothetical protein AVEN_131709-1 [Araneus ventricosus]
MTSAPPNRNPEFATVYSSLIKQFLPVPGLNVYTDGSKIEDKTGSAFCVMEEDITKYEWMAQLIPFNTVFQAELLAIQDACLWASKTTNRLSYGQTASRASIQLLQLTRRALLLNKHRKYY